MGKYSNKTEALTALNGIEDGEVLVFTPKEYNELLNNFKETTVDLELKSRIAKVYDDMDADFRTMTGLKRPDDQKTYKFWPDVVKQFKEKAELAQAEAEKLKVNPNPDTMKEIEALRKASIEKDNEWKAKFDKMQSELTAKDVKNTLDMSTRSFKLTNLPEPVLNTFIETAKNKLSQSAKFIDGQLVFMDADGNPKINKETFKPFTAEELLAIELDPVIDKGKTNQQGGGTQPPKIVTNKDGKLDIAVTIPTNVRTKLELTKHLIEVAGLPLGSKEHETAFAKYGEHLSLA